MAATRRQLEVSAKALKKVNKELNKIDLSKPKKATRRLELEVITKLSKALDLTSETPLYPFLDKVLDVCKTLVTVSVPALVAALSLRQSAILFDRKVLVLGLIIVILVVILVSGWCLWLYWDLTSPRQKIVNRILKSQVEIINEYEDEKSKPINEELTHIEARLQELNDESKRVNYFSLRKKIRRFFRLT